MSIGALTEYLDTVPGVGVNSIRGRALFDLVVSWDAAEVLEIGTGRAKSTCYLAYGVSLRAPKGRVVSVDSTLNHWSNPAAAEVVRACHLDAVVELVRAHSCGSWDLVKLKADGATFDLAFVDGPKSLSGFLATLVLVVEVLREGGLLIVDDADWTFASSNAGRTHFGVDTRAFSEEEWKSPPIAIGLGAMSDALCLAPLPSPEPSLRLYQKHNPLMSNAATRRQPTVHLG